jgi:hypothetical protein
MHVRALIRVCTVFRCLCLSLTIENSFDFLKPHKQLSRTNPRPKTDSQQNRSQQTVHHKLAQLTLHSSLWHYQNVKKSTFGFKSRCLLTEEKTSTSNKSSFLTLLRELKDSLFLIKPIFDLKKRASTITVAVSKAL